MNIHRRCYIAKNWPLNSPDLSSMETVWSMVQELVDEYTTSNKEDLIKSVCKDWAKLSQEYIYCIYLLYDSILTFSHLEPCVANNGEKVTKW